MTRQQNIELLQIVLNQSSSIDEAARALSEGYYRNINHYRKRIIKLLEAGVLIY